MRKGCHKMILTYNSTYFDGTRTYGGYSDIIVVKEHFVICWPDNLPLDVGSPLRNFGLDKPGMYISVVGLGVLGHVAMKLAKAFGAKVTVISTSPAKKKEAIEHLGPDSFLVSSDQAQLQHDGKLTLLGSPKALELPVMPMLAGRKIVAGSGIGGIKETQEMIEFCAKHNITADVEVIPMKYVNTAMDCLAKADVRYQFVINIGNMLKAA
ncbi:unnamed protein product [Ilex paraguariensis]|uniref:Alcohol dehydrogenase-like C-terminal domain-containing protein n=1 Tax=Ilex paraguariensis TaxID=185542 RepID=A0ABC8UXT5_9AQUA